MSNHSPAEYTISIKLKKIDDEMLFEGRVMELPDLVVYESTYTASYESLITLIEGLMEMDAERGVNFPKPLNTDNEYSGRVTLRMPKSLHRNLDYLAISEGCSLNQLIVNALSSYASGTSTIDQVVNKLPSLLAANPFFTSPKAYAIWDARSHERAEYKVEGITTNTSFTSISASKSSSALIIQPGH